MILYLDTSALVKLYVDEPGALAVRDAAARAQVNAVHDLTYVEAHSAFARRRREGIWDESGYRRILATLERDWSRLYRIGLAPALLRRAAAFTQRFALRAYDAVQLAAGVEVQQLVGGTAPVCFASFDERLVNSARQMGLHVMNPAGQ